MQVILLDNIRGIGYIGDVKSVADGYARNFLFPRNLAELATPTAVKKSEKLREKRETLLAQQKAQAETTAGKLAEFVLKFEGRASETGTLFAAISRKDIIRKIKEVTGMELADDMVHLSEHLKALGEHSVNLQLAPDVSVQVKVLISALKD